MTKLKIYEKGLRIAIEGCGHGTLNNIYSTVLRTEKTHNFKVDLLVICGDFQAVRNAQDLNCMSVPPKYRKLGDFAQYYSGKQKAPILTLFIGGNHEASNHNWELFYGGWVCPNIYYLGAAGVVQIGGLRIAGLSGIYNYPDYKKPHFERVPYGHKDVKTTYHVRQYDAYKLYQLRWPVDIGLSHDWPQGIEHNGNIDWLLKEKPWFKNDIQTSSLGSPPARSLLYKWKPRYWFSAHLHIKYSAIVDHTVPLGDQGNAGTSKFVGVFEEAIPEATSNEDEIDLGSDLEVDMDIGPTGAREGTPQVATKNHDKIDLNIDVDEPVTKRQKPESLTDVPPDVEDACTTTPESLQQPHVETRDRTGSMTVPSAKEIEESPASAQPTGRNISSSRSPSPKSVKTPNAVTKFLALDKCLPRRDFLQILQIPAERCFKPNDPKRLRLQYDPEWLAITRALNPFLATSYSEVNRLENDEARLQQMIDKELVWVEDNIIKQGKLYIPYNWQKTAPAEGERKLNPNQQPNEYNNPQTTAFCELLRIENKIWS